MSEIQLDTSFELWQPIRKGRSAPAAQPVKSEKKLQNKLYRGINNGSN